MIATSVTVHVLEEHLAAFIEATKSNHEASIKEPGNLRFDVLQARACPTQFMLYEVYESDEDAAAHKQTPHYQVWRDTVAKMMAKPREGIAHDVHFPTDPTRW